MKPHIHAEFIKLWADGVEIEYSPEGINVWYSLEEVPMWHPGCRYRVKAAIAKWPQTTMEDAELFATYNESTMMSSALRDVANAAIARTCESGALVPADKVREIEAKARAEGKRDVANPVRIIEAAWNHMKLGRLDPETIQIILLQAAK